VTRYELAVLGEWIIIVLFIISSHLLDPWPEYTSNHPWSISFNSPWAVWRGAFIINCDERGTKNHIIHDAWCFIGILIALAGRSVLDLVIYHPRIKPIATIIIGNIFINDGRINDMFLTGGSQAMQLPDRIDTKDRNSIGAIIIDSSLILIILAFEFDDHIVTRLKRIE